MDIRVLRADYREIEPLRELYRQECNCQIISDSILRRELADPYLILLAGNRAGYAGVWNRYNPGRVMEFHTLPELRAQALPMFRAMLAATGATAIQAQTNIPLMLLMLCDCAENIRPENVLFEDRRTTDLPCPPGASFRRGAEGPPAPDGTSRWVIEVGGEVVGWGDYLTHYNPPYGDIYMEVAEPARRRGIGSYLVQELKRVAYEAGRKPAARCNAGNTASRRTLERAGLLPCGRLLVGQVRPETRC